jgi:hypothetical protein
MMEDQFLKRLRKKARKGLRSFLGFVRELGDELKGVQTDLAIAVAATRPKAPRVLKTLMAQLPADKVAKIVATVV